MREAISGVVKKAIEELPDAETAGAAGGRERGT
jgi:hypothetical protein